MKMDGVELKAMRAGDVAWLVARHAALYADEAGFDETFAPEVRGAAEGFVADHDPACEVGWIAWTDADRVGSLFVTRDGKDARVRLFLLEPAWRGQGIGRAMLDRALQFAAGAGYDRMVVSTFDRHRAACRLYAASGFVETGAAPARAFGQDMVIRHFARVASVSRES